MKVMGIASVILTLCVVMTGCVSLGYDNRSGTYGYNQATVKTEGVTEERSIDEGEFDSLLIEANIHRLYIHLANGENGIKIEGDRAYFDAIDIENRNGRLRFTTDGALTERVDIYIAAPEFTKIDCRGAATFDGDGALEGTSLELSVAGACSGDLELMYDDVKIDIAGAGELTLKGEVADTRITCAGACTINARELTTQTCNIDIAGAGTVSIRCEKELDATIGGIGSIDYWGEASSSRVTGGLGKITHHDD